MTTTNTNDTTEAPDVGRKVGHNMPAADALAVLAALAETAGTDDTRPVLMRVHAETVRGLTVLASTDSYRMTRAVIHTPDATTLPSIDVPAYAVAAMTTAKTARAMFGTPAQRRSRACVGRIHVDADSIGIGNLHSQEHAILSAHAIADGATFPNVEKLWPDSETTTATVSADTLRQLVDSLPNKAPKRPNVQKDSVRVAVDSDGISVGAMRAAADTTGAAVETHLNAAYLRAAVMAVPPMCETITLRLQETLKPVVIDGDIPADSPYALLRFGTLVMPMRVNA